MTLEKVIYEIEQVILEFLRSTNNLDIEKKYEISEPPNDNLGDLTTNVAFLISNKNNTKPYEISEIIVKNFIQPHIKKNKRFSLLENVESHKSGHINFRINYSNLNKELLEIIKNDKIKLKDLGLGKNIIIEHTSVNPNKALHVGHLRNVILGDTLYRLFKATNYNPIVLNYVDDSGVQVADIIVAFKYAGFNQEPDLEIKYDHYCGEIYIKINNKFDEKPEIKEKRKEIIKEIEKGDSKIAEYTKNIVKRVLKEQLNTCWRIKARYDILNVESQIIESHLWEKIFTLLKEKNIITYVKEGKNKDCWVIKLKDEDKVIIRSDGTSTYIAKDIPYAIWKLGLINDPFEYNEFEKQWDNSMLWITKVNDKIKNKEKNTLFTKYFNNTEKVITIIDSRQTRLQNIISDILQKLDEDKKRYHYLGYESVALSSSTVKNLGFDGQNKIHNKVIQMSGRKGIVVNADDILDEIKKKIQTEILKRDSTLSENEINIISEGMAISTIRYSLMKQDLDKLIVFDIKEAINLNGDTSIYLQYSYARAQRILEKFNLENQNNKESERDLNDDVTRLLVNQEETDLIKEIFKINIIVGDAIKNLSPKLIPKYGYKLATKFNIFYETLSVLNEKDEKLKYARIILVKAFTVIMSTIFDLIGIQVLNKI
ncbi:MAG: arginine--tRNA ligase [Nitrososphaeraceae archaeon]